MRLDISLRDRWIVGAEYRIENQELRLLYEGAMRQFLKNAEPRNGMRPVEMLRHPDTTVAGRAHALAIADLVPIEPMNRVIESLGDASEVDEASIDQLWTSYVSAGLTPLQAEFLLAHMDIPIDGSHVIAIPADWSHEVSPFQWACAVGSKRFISALISIAGVESMNGLNRYCWSAIDIALANNQSQIAEELNRRGSHPAGWGTEMLFREFGL